MKVSAEAVGQDHIGEPISDAVIAVMREAIRRGVCVSFDPRAVNEAAESQTVDDETPRRLFDAHAEQLMVFPRSGSAPQSPRPHASSHLAARASSRPREHRAKSSRATSSRGDPDDPDSLPPRPCPGCGETFTPIDRRQKFCTKTCGNANRQREFKAKVRAAHAADGIMSAKERDALVRTPTRVRERYVTRLVRGSRRFEVSQLAEELGFASRPMNGRLHWPDSIAMREVVVETVELTREQEGLGREMGAV